MKLRIKLKIILFFGFFALAGCSDSSQGGNSQTQEEYQTGVTLELVVENPLFIENGASVSKSGKTGNQDTLVSAAPKDSKNTPFSDYKWYVDGEAAAAGSRHFNLKAQDYTLGSHYLSASAVLGESVYHAGLFFIVGP
ncbi:MAG: hypothetical protein LBC53_10095 [Spirochaetaceae bacterium]|jgi:hypothetical protein|nr:hypothetical protein [Spirochaetaceae bacterium]